MRTSRPRSSFSRRCRCSRECRTCLSTSCVRRLQLLPQRLQSKLQWRIFINSSPGSEKSMMLLRTSPGNLGMPCDFCFWPPNTSMTAYRRSKYGFVFSHSLQTLGSSFRFLASTRENPSRGFGSPQRAHSMVSTVHILQRRWPWGRIICPFEYCASASSAPQALQGCLTQSLQRRVRWSGAWPSGCGSSPAPAPAGSESIFVAFRNWLRPNMSSGRARPHEPQR
mmetsp:Transcript_78252/g.221229  ORF Transcript_78252/g.221229 Transcript_78252/m.221229 type:complete len:224 (-) Transcript_78252:203-874(-)